jgi:hypothetical protein
MKSAMQYTMGAAVLVLLMGVVVVSCSCKKLVTEAGESSGTQRKGNVSLS